MSNKMNYIELITSDIVQEIFYRLDAAGKFTFAIAYPNYKCLLDKYCLCSDSQTIEECFTIFMKRSIEKAKKAYRKARNATEGIKVLFNALETLYETMKHVPLSDEAIKMIYKTNKSTFAWWPFLTPTQNLMSYIFYPHELNDLYDSLYSILCRGEVVASLIFSAKFCDPLALHYLRRMLDMDEQSVYDDNDEIDEDDPRMSVIVKNRKIISDNMGDLIDKLNFHIHNNDHVTLWAIKILRDNEYQVTNPKMGDLHDFRYHYYMNTPENPHMILQNDQFATHKKLYLGLAECCNENYYPTLLSLIDKANHTWKQELTDIIHENITCDGVKLNQLAFDMCIQAGSNGHADGYFEAGEILRNYHNNKNLLKAVNERQGRTYIDLFEIAAKDGMLSAYYEIINYYQRYNEHDKVKETYLKLGFKGERSRFCDVRKYAQTVDEYADYDERSKNFDANIAYNYISKHIRKGMC
jgi:hypothetical protein